MYKSFIRPLLFLMNPEAVHHLIVSFLKFGFKIPGIAPLCRAFFCVKSKKLEREFLGIKFDNPVGFAAGFDKNAEVYNEFSNFGFSFIEIGTVTPKPQPGNPKPRSFRIPKDSGLINRMGFNNHGVDKAAERLRKKDPKIVIGGNIGKNTATPNENALDDYVYGFETLYPYVDYFVVNVSCPNVKDLRKLQDKDSLLKILNSLVEIRKGESTRKPILLKISPDLNSSQLDEMLELYNETDIDGMVATNTTVSRDDLKTTGNKISEIGNGGMSGKPITDKSTEVIRYLSKKTEGKMPIIGVGGIMSTNDAIDKLKAGATLVQVYTGFIYEGPAFVKKINKAILKEI